MNKFTALFILMSLNISLTACGSGSFNTNGTNYYSASSTAFYQIESQSGESAILNIITSNGNKLSNVPLTLTASGYSFSTTINNDQVNGTIVLKNNLMGINITSTSGNTQSFSDFATLSINTNNSPIPSGTYNTVCDRDNISACQITINNNQISITEYSISGQPTSLCTNTDMITMNGNAINPYLLSFTCAVQGNTHQGTWYIMPLVINGTTGIMIDEYNASLNAPDSATDEIAFIQDSFIPAGEYNYLYKGIVNNQSGISTANFTGRAINNPTVGTCAGAACSLNENQFGGMLGSSGNVMIGFDYYLVNGLINYNLVGSTVMNIFVDSFSGIYF